MKISKSKLEQIIKEEIELNEYAAALISRFGPTVVNQLKNLPKYVAGNVAWDAGVNAFTGEDEPEVEISPDASELTKAVGLSAGRAITDKDTFDYPGQEKDLDGFDTPLNVRSTNDELWAYNESKQITSNDIKSIQKDIQYYIKQYDKAETDDDKEGWRAAIESGKKDLQDLMQKRGRNESVNEEKLNEAKETIFDVAARVLQNKQNENYKSSKGMVKLDLQTANLLVQVFKKVKPKMRKILSDLGHKNPAQLVQTLRAVIK